MTPEDLLAEARERGIVLRAAGDRLQFRPVNRVPPELREELRQHKAQLLAILKAGPTVGESLPAGLRSSEWPLLDEENLRMSLAEFAEARLVVRVWSECLNERLVFASDNAVLDPGEREPVYRALELRELVGMNAVDLRCVHQVKKVFGGTIQPS
jgi:TubC N-terminal docking domain